MRRVHRDADVVRRLVHELLAVGADLRVEQRVLAQRERGRLHQQRHQREVGHAVRRGHRLEHLG